MEPEQQDDAGMPTLPHRLLQRIALREEAADPADQPADGCGSASIPCRRYEGSGGAASVHQDFPFASSESSGVTKTREWWRTRRPNLACTIGGIQAYVEQALVYSYMIERRRSFARDGKDRHYRKSKGIRSARLRTTRRPLACGHWSRPSLAQWQYDGPV